MNAKTFAASLFAALALVGCTMTKQVKGIPDLPLPPATTALPPSTTTFAQLIAPRIAAAKDVLTKDRAAYDACMAESPFDQKLRLATAARCLSDAADLGKYLKSVLATGPAECLTDALGTMAGDLRKQFNSKAEADAAATEILDKATYQCQK
jgi:hypothetical protein